MMVLVLLSLIWKVEVCVPRAWVSNVFGNFKRALQVSGDLLPVYGLAAFAKSLHVDCVLS